MKNKQFEEWLINEYPDAIELTGIDCISMHVDFYELPFSMQVGVYLEFFLSIGKHLWVKPQYNSQAELTSWVYMVNDQVTGYFIEDNMMGALEGNIEWQLEELER